MQTRATHHIPDLLLACLHREAGHMPTTELAVVGDADWQALLALATDQRVRPLLYQQFQVHGLDHTVPPAISQTLHAFYLRTALQTTWRQRALHEIALALQAVNIPLIVLKGMFLAEAVFANLALREMDDIDILVPLAQLDRASTALIALGYTPVASPIDVQKHHLPFYSKPGAPPVELHWNIVPAGHHYSIAPDSLWQRALPVRIAGISVLGLAPEDLLLHLCAHTAYVHEFMFGLRPSWDIAAVIDHYGQHLRWDTVVQRAEQWGWQRGTYLALCLAQTLVGAAVPPEVLQHLAPSEDAATAVAIARSQVLSDTQFQQSLPQNLAWAWQQSGLKSKLRAFVGRVFVSKTELARKYAIAPNVPTIYAYYLVRAKDLLLHQGRMVLLLLHGERDATSLAYRKHWLSEWLALKARG